MDNIFVARQPIYNRELEVVAYELLYRGDQPGHAGVVDGDQATSQVLVNTFTEIGLERLVGDVPAFVNLTRPYLTGEYELPFPPGQVALEVLEDIRPDPPLVEGIRQLSDQGYLIVLDDFDYRPEFDPVLDCADLVKLEVQQASETELGRTVAQMRRFNVQLLAEKIETDWQFRICRDLGFDFFQGYYFSRPNLVSGKRHANSKIGLMPLLAKLNDEDADFTELETLIAQDQVLVYRLLRCANSAAVAPRHPIESLRNALLMLGTRTVRTWILLISLSAVDDKPPELCRIALARARMCELLAHEFRSASPNACFTVGLLSLLDSLLNQPMEEVVSSLPLTDEIKEALLHRAGPLGRVLQCVCDYEQGHWHALDSTPAESSLAKAYLQALTWADDIMDVITPTRSPHSLAGT